MNSLFHRRIVLVAAGLLVFVLKASAADNKALDRYLYNSLRYVINYGVDLYNAGRVEDCYAHFRQSLQDLEPVLTAHPDLQKTIKEGLDKVEKDPAWRAEMAAKATMPNPQLAPVDRQKAFALRAVFNEVRNGLSPDGMKAGPAKPPRKDVVEAGKPGAAAGGGGTVRGRVTADGKPLAHGTIALIAPGGQAISDAIEADGSYTIENVVPGQYRVTITRGKDVPAKYADPKTTPLVVNVMQGANTHDIALMK